MDVQLPPNDPRLRALASRYPLTKPNAPKLSAYVDAIVAVEDSHWLTNYGPTNHRLEAEIIDKVFGGRGHCLTVCNATTGLIIALKLATMGHKRHRRFVIMPSFTFAAAAHAVLWAGLTPLLVDIDPLDWSASHEEEERLITRYGDRVAAIMPYAAFGSCIDLEHYDRLSERYELPVVVDAAASLGSCDDLGQAFGYGSQHTIVFSMHATKAFGVGECGVIYSCDKTKIDTLRRMGNFGLDADRAAILPGLNSKISEIAALSALIKLSDYRTQILHRAELAQVYRDELPDWTGQTCDGSLTAYQFMPFLLPRKMRQHRDMICQRLDGAGIGTGRYFSPHIHQQPYFRRRCVAGPLDVTDDIASRVISLPISDFLMVDDVLQICAAIHGIEDSLPVDVAAAYMADRTCSPDAAVL